MLDLYGLKLDPRRIVSTLSVGERQRIEIVRALLLNPKLLIMDEPTSVLTPQEVEQLFETLRKLAGAGLLDPLHLAQAARDRRACARRRRSCAAASSSPNAIPRQETSRSMAELMIGANLKEIARGAGRAFGAEKFAARALEPAQARRFRRRAQGHQLLACAPAKFSASPASPATARTN